MIINNIASKIESNVSSDKTQKMTVKQSGKLFTLLSDNLYSNKIGSIIRELSCNAKDSHIEAKNNDPFDVFLPCVLDPMFKIKDYGIGMSKDDVINIFSCYGESTKGESNQLIGAFGLGSKTPFAYTDSFNITSVYENKKTSYSIYIDSEGFPAISEMFSIDTLERNGFEIFFGVDEKDFQNFKHEIMIQLQYFDFNYNVDGKLIPHYKFENIMYEDDNCVITKERYATTETHILFAGLCYDANYKYEISGLNLFLKFDIGDVEVSLSREDIAYTDRTAEKISEKINLVKRDFVNFLRSKEKDFDYAFDYECWLYQNYDIAWIIKEIIGFYNVTKEINLLSYDKLRFYNEEKRIKKLYISKRYVSNIFLNTTDPKLTAKKCFEIYSETFVLPKTGYTKKDFIEVKKQMNQLKMDIDSDKICVEFTKDQIKEINNITFTPHEYESEISYTEIVGDGTYSQLKYLYESDIEKLKDGTIDNPLFLVKYKNDITDTDTKDNNVLFYYSKLNLVSAICDRKNVYCFTKSQYNKLKKQSWFKYFKSVKQEIIDKVVEYKKNEDQYNLTDKQFHSLYKVTGYSNVNKLEDKTLKNYCANQKIVLNYNLKHFLTNDNWTNIKLNIKKSDDEVNELDERYKFLEDLGGYSSTDKTTFTEVLNFLYRRSLKND